MSTLSLTLTVASAIDAATLLTQESGLSKGRIKDAMQKGAVWMQRPRQTGKRLRRATQQLIPGDVITLHYDAELLARTPAEAVCLLDHRKYSVWCKPAGMLTQGNEFGDHCSLLRLAEQYFTPRREVFPVHRLDREAMGLVLIAHDKQTAGKFSNLFQGDGVEKYYRVILRGDMRATMQGCIDVPLDGKVARTDYTVLEYDATHDVSRVRARIHTGRTHQLRRHFEAIGHPVMGDPRYGVDNKNASGMKLLAESLAFTCPLRHERVEIDLWQHQANAVVANCLAAITTLE